MTKDTQASMAIIASVLLFFAFLLWAFPTWNVWRAGLSGEADLVKAEQTKRIMIETAKAEKTASVYRAEAIKIWEQRQKNILSIENKNSCKLSANLSVRGI